MPFTGANANIGGRYQQATQSGAVLGLSMGLCNQCVPLWTERRLGTRYGVRCSRSVRPVVRLAHPNARCTRSVSPCCANHSRVKEGILAQIGRCHTSARRCSRNCAASYAAIGLRSWRAHDLTSPGARSAQAMDTSGAALNNMNISRISININTYLNANRNITIYDSLLLRFNNQ